jgi:biopolymer transport protein TolR
MMADINVTSLVDVSLVLLIIFMLTAPFIQGGVEIDLPQTSDSGMDIREGVVLSIGADRSVFIGDVEVRNDNLEGELRRRYAEDPGRPIFLRADKGVDYGFVVQVIAAAKSSGFVNLGLVTQPEPRDVLGRQRSAGP